jgi:alkaline phosphatase
MKADATTLADLAGFIETTFGFDMDGDGTGIALSLLEQARLDQAFTDWKAAAPAAGTIEAEQYYLNYGGYNQLIVTCTHILNQRAGIGWTTYSHTGVQVPVFAEGVVTME